MFLMFSVERLTFEEFFEHPFLLQCNNEESTSQQSLHLHQGELLRQDITGNLEFFLIIFPIL